MEGAIVYNSDVALNDSNKDFTVPAGKVWRLKMLVGKLISTATVGNRQMQIVIKDAAAGNVIWTKNFGQVQTASLTRYYYAAADLPNDAAFDASGNIRAQLYQWEIPAGWVIQLWDSAAIAAAADDLEYRLIVEELRP